MAAFVDSLAPLLTYVLAAAIPVLVLRGREYQRSRWVIGAVLAHLALVNVFNRSVWPALRPAPVGVDHLPREGEYMRGSKAELDAMLQYIAENLVFSMATSLVLILGLTLVWRFTGAAQKPASSSG